LGKLPKTGLSSMNAASVGLLMTVAGLFMMVTPLFINRRKLWKR
jgi:LPXTG-motif cell wall-anchored protein